MSGGGKGIDIGTQVPCPWGGGKGEGEGTLPCDLSNDVSHVTLPLPSNRQTPVKTLPSPNFVYR